MPRRFSILRIIASIFACGLIITGAWFFYAGQQIAWGFDHQRAHPLAILDCDLSKPSEFTIPLRVDYPYGHGFILSVDGPPRTSERGTPEPWLAGLRGIAVTESARYGSGNPEQLNDGHSAWIDSNSIVKLGGSPKGDYIIRVVVTDGAPQLASIPHRIVVMNSVCGCELISAHVLRIIGGAVAILGLIIACFALFKPRTAPAHPLTPSSTPSPTPAP
ncbi:MAG: hypothetical protein K2W85_07205 [Phycisphaerales bacterium]|nr:hypothetical protein [Phycisphaerales bacterium]